MNYIHERSDWPAFRWNTGTLAARLAAVRHRQGRLLGRTEGIGLELRNDATSRTLTQDVVKSSEIEGVILDDEQVRLAIARRLGINIGALTHIDRDVEGIVELVLDATRHYDTPLTAERLFDWHAALFPTGRSGMRKITVGVWRADRSGPVQVASGPSGREHVHFQAPNADRVDTEMNTFLAWYNRKSDVDPVIRAAIAHLWFVTIHPFEDGNGRIGRAITDMALAKSERSTERFYSMSTQIQQERKAYYEVLETTQKGDLDITRWLDWFLNCLEKAIEKADAALASVLSKAHFWRDYAQIPFNSRQCDMLNRILDGFEGKVTSSKWARIERCSPDTALRDISELVAQGILQKEPAGGRSTSYSLVSLRSKTPGRV